MFRFVLFLHSQPHLFSNCCIPDLCSVLCAFHHFLLSALPSVTGGHVLRPGGVSGEDVWNCLSQLGFGRKPTCMFILKTTKIMYSAGNSALCNHVSVLLEPSLWFRLFRRRIAARSFWACVSRAQRPFVDGAQRWPRWCHHKKHTVIDCCAPLFVRVCLHPQCVSPVRLLGDGAPLEQCVSAGEKPAD